MSKTKKESIDKIDEGEQDDPFVLANSYTASTGLTAYCNPIKQNSFVRIEHKIQSTYEANGEPISPPTYTVPLAFGAGDQLFVHDEQSLVVEGDDDATLQNQTDWAEHIAAHNKLHSEIERAQLRYIALRGIDFARSITSELFEEWKKEQNFLGSLPSLEDDQKLFCILDSFLVTTYTDAEENEEISDFGKALSVCLNLGSRNPSEEQVALFQATFRNKMA